MKKDFGWSKSAGEYINLYQSAVKPSGIFI